MKWKVVDSARFSSRVLSDGIVDPASRRNGPIPIAVPVTLTPNIAIICAAHLNKIDRNSFNSYGLNNGNNSSPRTVLTGHISLTGSINYKLSLIDRIRSKHTISISTS